MFNIDRRLGHKLDKSGGDITGDLSISGELSVSGTSLNDLLSQIVPSGLVLAFAGTSAPTNYLLCDGSAVSRTTYAKLFSVIGTAHGQGDGSTTFNLPDYRGRFLRGVDGSAGNDPDKTTRTAMAAGGSTGNSVGSVQADDFKSHTHTYGYKNNTYLIAAGGFGALDNTNITPNTGSAGGNETRPKNAYVNYIIKI